MEVFAQDRRVVLTDLTFPEAKRASVCLLSVKHETSWSFREPVEHPGRSPSTVAYGLRRLSVTTGC
ncbi:hypothetical protein ACFVWT_18700 [Arthrobacter sp. NPDC058288]|uniref:hypothetical protein n=1 Tax=Arthrobacter sp. NPDC058288 TaxID=3346424 RepID=UPI0036E0EA81